MGKNIIFLLQFLFAAFLFPQEQFTEQTSISLPGVGNSSVAWGDYDNDGDLDILLTGYTGYPTAPRSEIYRNNGNNTFTEQTSIYLTGVDYSSVAWGDYDNDGDLDILLTGAGADPSKIYRNNGNNTFSEQTEISLTGIYYGSVAWGDYDNDGDLDILLTGFSSPGQVSKIYRNNGNNTFSEQTEISLTGVYYSSVAWGDYDNDGDLDILLTGAINISNGQAVSKIYRNNGDNTFTEQTSISLAAVYYGSVAWGDYDNDGDLDILLTGWAGTLVSKIYRNNGDNTFTEQTGISLTGVCWGSVAWGDYDNDGDLDILLTGYLNGGRVSKIYRNNGDNTFTEQSSISLRAVHSSSVALADYDNDGDMDILLTGSTIDTTVSKIYRNNNITPNTQPIPPSNLQSVFSGQDVTFSWDKSTDNETPQNGLRYNLVIGSAPDAVNTLSPMSDRNTGFRRVINLGNTNHNNSWTIKGLDLLHTYYWSVQAIDNCFAASDFAPEQSFRLTSIEGEQFNKLPTEYELIQNYPNPFNPSTTIRYSIINPELVRIKIYDILGREVKTLVNELKQTGNYEVQFDASGLASGIYLYRIESGSFVQTKKMILLK
jgi:predicted nucleotidyltransferase